MKLTGSTVSRGLVLLEPDESGVQVMVKVAATIAMARCDRCGTRCRVLPCDALPRKTFGLAVIEHEVSAYGRGDQSLRQVAWRQLGDPDGVAWSGHPLAVGAGETRQQVGGADGTDEVEGRRSRRRLTVLPGEDDRGQVGVVVNVEVGERDMRDLLPRDRELRQPSRGARAAVDQQFCVPGLDVIAGAAALGSRPRGRERRAAARGYRYERAVRYPGCVALRPRRWPRPPARLVMAYLDASSSLTSVPHPSYATPGGVRRSWRVVRSAVDRLR